MMMVAVKTAVHDAAIFERIRTKFDTDVRNQIPKRVLLSNGLSLVHTGDYSRRKWSPTKCRRFRSLGYSFGDYKYI